MWIATWMAVAAAEGPLAWQWPDGTHREYYLETEVQLPSLTMVYAERNTNARVSTIRVAMVVDCSSARAIGTKAHELWCDIVDVTLTGAPIAADVGVLAPVLVEMDETLTAASLQVQLRNDGRVSNVDLEGVARPNRRISWNAELFRLFLVRAVAGLDMQLPRGDVGATTVWSQRDPLLYDTPNPKGSQGSGEIAYRIRSDSDAAVVIEAAGRGMTSPSTDSVAGLSNLYQIELESVARFDRSGFLRQRTWTVVGNLTAGSVLAEGLAGVPYVQRGRLVLIDDPSLRPDLGSSGEMEPSTPLGTLSQMPTNGGSLDAGSR